MNTANTLTERHQALLSSQPQLRQRDAARQLGVSEAELAANLAGSRLLAWQRPLLDELASLGQLKAITRNELAVHETIGSFNQLSGGQEIALQLDPDGLDLRLFLKHWHCVLACRQDGPRGTLHSLQFFDRHGTAVIKLYLQDANKLPALEALIARHQLPLTQLPAFEPASTQPSELPPTADLADFRAGWLALQDVHHFHSLLGKHALSRRQAFRHAPAGHAEALARTGVETLLQQAAAAQLPIMVFVGNRGTVQIHSGPVKTIRRVGDWLNVLDPQFNLHLQDGGIAELWRIRRPTRDGIITAIEVLDADGQTIVTFFGRRIEGEAEHGGWRQLADSLPQQELDHA